MRVIFALVILSCLLGCTFAVRSQWNQGKRAKGDDKVTVRFALTQQNLDVLEVFIHYFFVWLMMFFGIDGLL